MHNLVVVVLDSLRFDAWTAARPRTLARLGEVERRWSYASWTAPSHYNLLMGLMPHTSPSHVYASDHYREDFERYAQRLGVDSFEFRNVLPSLNLPTYLRDTLGYRTGARVSMPVLNPATPMSVGFDDYQLMSSHNDFPAMLESIELGRDQPHFWLLNVGETHYPYATPYEDPSTWPRVSGVHGVLKRMGDDGEGEPFLDAAQLAELQQRQIDALTFVDEAIGQLFDLAPPGTWVVVTSDHGELFGEEGYFGHGPINHPKVLEVPFVEGQIR